jgi:hypothetical protein
VQSSVADAEVSGRIAPPNPTRRTLKTTDAIDPICLVMDLSVNSRSREVVQVGPRKDFIVLKCPSRFWSQCAAKPAFQACVRDKNAARMSVEVVRQKLPPAARTFATAGHVRFGSKPEILTATKCCGFASSVTVKVRGPVGEIRPDNSITSSAWPSSETMLLVVPRRRVSAAGGGLPRSRQSQINPLSSGLIVRIVIVWQASQT